MTAIVVIPPGTHWSLPPPWYGIVHWGLIALLVILAALLIALTAWALIDR